MDRRQKNEQFADQPSADQLSLNLDTDITRSMGPVLICCNHSLYNLYV